MNNRSGARDASLAGAETWHSREGPDVLVLMDVVPEHGLNGMQAAERAARFGANLLPSRPRRGPVLRFLAQFHNVLIYLLLAAAATTVWLGHRVDAVVILAAVLVNALIGFVQEGSAERALQAIGSLLPFTAVALRDGRRLEIQATQLVPGDIVYLAPGDKVPADLRLVSARGLRIDESVLTGESVVADKSTDSVPEAAALAERHCMAYSGTLVRHGAGAGVVVAIANETEIGRISAMLDAIEPLTTPLLRKIAEFGRGITVAVLLVAGAMFAFGTLLRGYSAGDMFAAAVGLAVAAVPEGLPAVMTITLAVGVRRMARQHAIIRRLPAVEAIGAATVICTDKTGTLTRNEMAVRQIIAADSVVEVTADGYAPHGRFACRGARLDPRAHADIRDIAQACLLCNDAQLHCIDGQWELSGDPTEGALLSFALKAGLDASAERSRFPRLDGIPFESEHGFMATVHGLPDGTRRVYLKGAPERVLPLCAWQLAQDEQRAVAPAAWHAVMEEAADRGMRLIAVARRDGQQASEIGLHQVRSGGFTLLGVLAMDDPPRAEAVAAVARCLSAGIRVKMITGDHAGTARAIAVQLGFPQPVRSLTGAEIEQFDDTRLDAAIAGTDVFARAAPEHKLRLVRALQRSGAVVVMTGDGVNDAPALKSADVGVAMGRKGTEAAKEAAEVVLADDNFATLAAAVEEGRVVYDNIRKTIAFTLPTNGGEAGMLIVAILFGLTLPITPVQILWVNMVTEITLSLALAVEKPEEDVMRRPPRHPAEALVTRLLVWRIVLVSLLMVGGCMGLYLWELALGASLAQARTVVVNALVVGHVAYLFSSRRLTASALSWEGISGNRVALLAIGACMALQMLLTYWTPAQDWFGTGAIAWEAWMRIIGFGLALLLVVEMDKGWRRRTA